MFVACSGTSADPIDGSADVALRDAAAEVSPGVDAGGVDASDAAAPGLHIDVSQTSVSGISSGGFMAVQFHVAFSSITKGAAIFAAGPYMCSKGSVTTALTSCSSGYPAIDVPALVTLTNQNATAGAIDDPANLATQHVYIFGGASDAIVSPTVVDALDAYYASFISSASIDYVNRRPGTNHTWPTLAYGNACSLFASPYIGNCTYDGAGAALAQIYGTLTPMATTLGGMFLTIPQALFIADPGSYSLGDNAYAYIPAACASGETCKVHVSFHGCLQNETSVGDAFYTHSGLDEWADTNHIVVLYPQTVATSAPQNPEGCWDFWGYSSADFAKKTGPQLATVRAMIDWLASPK